MQGQLFSTATSGMACPALRRTKTSGRSVQSACRVRAGTRSSDLRAALENANGVAGRAPRWQARKLSMQRDHSVCTEATCTGIPDRCLVRLELSRDQSTT